MVEKNFPKSAKELYNNLMKVNKFNAIKIILKAVEKLYPFLLKAKESNNYKKIWMSVNTGNSPDERERKGTIQLNGTCPNCKNTLSDTGGLIRVEPNPKNMRGTQYGRYCLNCGKIYLKEGRSKSYLERKTPLIYKSVLKI